MRGKIASIQFLRFIAATLVVMFHTAVALEKYFTGSLPHALLSNAVLGASGVHIFFVISGFIMVYTSFDTMNDSFDPKRFAFRRFIRIYPIYILYSLFYLYFYFAFGVGKDLSPIQFGGSLLLLPGYSSLIIGPGWTLSYEVYFYLCFGIAMMLGLRRGLGALTLFFVMAIAAGLVFGTSSAAIHVFTSSLLIEFLFGAWIGYLTLSSSLRVGNSTANAMLVASGAGFLAGPMFGFSHLPSALTWGVPSALLVGGLVFREKNGSIPIFIRRCSFLGDSSYSLYLLHVVLIDAVIFLAIPILGPWSTSNFQFGAFGMIAIWLAIPMYCVGVALVSYQFIERRMLRQLQRLYRRNYSPASGKPGIG